MPFRARIRGSRPSRPRGDPGGERYAVRPFGYTEPGSAQPVGVLAASEVVAVARDARSVTFNWSTPTLAAGLHLVYTLPLVWILDRVIARQQLLSGRGEIITP